MPSPAPRWLAGGALFTGLLLLVGLTYREALDAWFAADDFLWLEISTPADVARSFVGPWGHGPAYRPLARASFLADYALFGLAAPGWHAHSLLLLALVATLLGLLVHRLWSDRLLAAATAAIFALLPTGYENAVWISGRVHLLGLGSSLAALLAWDRHLVSGARRDAIVAVVAFALALGCYEASVYVVPLAALLALHRRRRLARPRAVLAWGGAGVALVLAYLAFRHAAVGPEPLYPTRALADLFAAPFAAHLARAARALLRVFAPLWPGLVAAVVLTAAFAPRYLGIAAAGGVVAAVGYAPFAIVDGPVASRFLFASQIGLALGLGALVAGVARCPRIGRAAAIVGLLALLVAEGRETARIAHEWRVAGAIGRRVLAGIAAATPDPHADGVTVVFGVPTSRGRAMVFETYFDAAVRSFLPEYRRFALPSEEIALAAAEPERLARIAHFWDTDAAARAQRGGGPNPCASARAALAIGVDAFLDGLAGCGAIFLAVDPHTHEVRRLDANAAVDRLRSPVAAPRT